MVRWGASQRRLYMVTTPLWSSLRCTSQLGLLVVASLFGCSSSPDLPPLASGAITQINPTTSSGTGSSQTCADGEQRSCSKTLSQQGSVLSCYYGTQTCGVGIWSDCGQGTVALQSAPPKGGRQLASISTPHPCLDNPCDPSCQNYLEVPPKNGLTAQYNNVNAVWETGSLSSFPTNVLNLVSNTPCETAADCQQNQHCVNVATDASCADNKCETGPSLGGNCNDRCVASICKQTPSCCQSSGPTSCNPGDTPSSDGSRCFHQITQTLNWFDARTACQALGTGTNWDLVCITNASDETLITGQNNTDSWMGLKRVTDDVTQSPFACVNGEQTLNSGNPSGLPWNQATGEPNNSGGDENCAEIYAASGLWNDLNCNDALQASWCEGPAIGAGSWTADCVNDVASVCGATCGASGTNQPGTCQAWAPGQINTNDNAPDLSIGVPCQGQVPVCNHGTLSAPAGAIVYVLPTNTPQFGTAASPDPTTALGSCTTSTAITPGTCAMVGGCSNYLNNGAGVNTNDAGSSNETVLWVTLPPPGGEARTDDNWGYNISPNMNCGAPQCLSASGASSCSTTTNTQTFDYQGICPSADQVPQWSFLTFDSVTPGDSSINFTVVAAPTVNQLATEPAVSLVTATQAAGNNECQLSGPAPNCPINLYSALLPNGTENSALLRLIITINPSSDGTQSPILNDWQISYSCPAGT